MELEILILLWNYEAIFRKILVLIGIMVLFPTPVIISNSYESYLTSKIVFK